MVAELKIETAKRMQKLNDNNTFESVKPFDMAKAIAATIGNLVSMTKIEGLECELKEEVITVPHIVWPESSGLPADYHQTTTGKLYEFSYKFPVAVQWLSHQTISPTDFPMDCPVNRHWTYA